MKKTIAISAILISMVFLVACTKTNANANANVDSVAVSKKSEKQLSWSKKATAGMNWQDANKYCENLEEDGNSDWRLPTISELRTLVRNKPQTEPGGICQVTDDCLSTNCLSKGGEYSCWLINVDCLQKGNSPRNCLVNNLPQWQPKPKGFYSKLGDVGPFWSSSPCTDDANSAWGFCFSFGCVHNNLKSKELAVRCVR